MKKQKPLVTVCCITYNHKPYIRDAIEDFLMQKTNFPFKGKCLQVVNKWEKSTKFFRLVY